MRMRLIQRILTGTAAILAVTAWLGTAGAQVQPTVSVVADPSVATIEGNCTGSPVATPGAFVFTRDETTGALTVPFTVGGDAVAGVDYEAIPDSVEFADGEGNAIVEVVPLGLGTAGPLTSVTVTIDPDPAYQVGSDATAAVRFLESTPSCIDPSPPAPAPAPAPVPLAPRFTG